MEQGQESWGTNTAGGNHININSLARQQVPDDSNPQIIDGQPKKKKKKEPYRKEVQKSYRQRLKNKRADVEAAVEETKRELEALTISNRCLQDSQHVLELLTTEASHLLNTLGNMRTQGVVPKHNITALPADDLNQMANNVLDSVFSGAGAFSDDRVKSVLVLPAPFILKIETDFMARLDSFMAEWRVCYSSRDKIELRLSQALQTRIKLSVFFPLINPEAAVQFIKRRKPPPPGTASGDDAKKALSCVLEGLQLESKHKRTIINASKDYQESVACLRAEMAMAQLALCAGPGAIGPFPDPEKGILPGQMSTRAQVSISAAESASILTRMPMRMVHHYVRLAEAVLTPLSTVQYANLLLGCMPYLPDYIQVCEIVSATVS